MEEQLNEIFTTYNDNLNEASNKLQNSFIEASNNLQNSLIEASNDLQNSLKKASNSLQTELVTVFKNEIQSEVKKALESYGIVVSRQPSVAQQQQEQQDPGRSTSPSLAGGAGSSHTPHNISLNSALSDEGNRPWMNWFVNATAKHCKLSAKTRLEMIPALSACIRGDKDAYKKWCQNRLNPPAHKTFNSQCKLLEPILERFNEQDLNSGTVTREDIIQACQTVERTPLQPSPLKRNRRKRRSIQDEAVNKKRRRTVLSDASANETQIEQREGDAGEIEFQNNDPNDSLDIINDDAEQNENDDVLRMQQPRQMISRDQFVERVRTKNYSGEATPEAVAVYVLTGREMAKHHNVVLSELAKASALVDRELEGVDCYD